MSNGLGRVWTAKVAWQDEREQKRFYLVTNKLEHRPFLLSTHDLIQNKNRSSSADTRWGRAMANLGQRITHPANSTVAGGCDTTQVDNTVVQAFLYL